MDKNIIDLLTACSLFNNMTSSEVESFLNKYNYRVEQYNKDDIFALAGEKVNYLMIVLEGTLIARMVSQSGKFLQVDRIESGRVVASAMLFASNNTFPVNVIPENNTSVFFMHRDSFIQAMRDNDKLLYNFIRIVSDINKFLSSKLHTLTLKTIRGKLAEYILSESEKQNNVNPISLSLTRQELADKLAVTRQALIRSLTEMQEENLIAIDGREITILSRTQLEYEE